MRFCPSISNVRVHISKAKQDSISSTLAMTQAYAGVVAYKAFGPLIIHVVLRHLQSLMIVCVCVCGGFITDKYVSRKQKRGKYRSGRNGQTQLC